MTKKICRHCKNRGVNRPKGLCWSCYYTPEIHRLYPRGSANAGTEKFAHRGVPDFHHAAPDDDPVPILQGTPEKLAVLERRAAEGKNLFHKHDGRE